MAFVTISRLATKRLMGAQHPLFKTHGAIAMASASSGIQAIEQKPGETFDEKNARLNRPMSPHLTIYKFQMTTVLSITHRFTGTALACYAIAFASVPMLPHDISYYIAAIEAAQPGTLTILAAKFMFAFPFMYHTCNGVRHLIWDSGRHLNKQAVVTTGTAMLAATAITTILMLCL